MEEFQAESLVIISLGAFILPLLAQRIKIPGIVLEIAYGITVGPILGIVDFRVYIWFSNTWLFVVNVFIRF